MVLAQSYSLIAAKNATRPAYRYLGKETFHRDLKDFVGRLSYLYQAEIGPKARVAMLTRNSPSMISTFLALTNIRSVVIPVDPDLPLDETIAWIKESKASYLAVTEDLVPKAREMIQGGHVKVKLVEIERKQGGEYDPVFSAAPDQQPQENDVVLWLRTSGNLDEPKFVAHTHKQLNHLASAARGACAYGPNDRVHATMSWANPFAFVHGMLLPLLSATPIVIDHGLLDGSPAAGGGAGEFLKFLRESQVTRMVGTPGYFRKVLVACKTEKQTLPPKLRSVTVGLGPLPADLAKIFGMMKVHVAQVYGLTEAVWTVAMQKAPATDEPPAENQASSAMSILPGLKYRVLDAAGDELPGPDLRIGPLAITGPTVMSGYPDKEKETKLAIRGTWLQTGDVVALEGDGQNVEETKLKFLGRREDLLESDGRWSSLAKLHAALRAVPGVTDGAGFMIVSSKGERSLIAAVVKDPAVGILTDKQVQGHLAGALPLSLLPQAVVFTDAIPRDAGGNVHGERLRRQFAGLTG